MPTPLPIYDISGNMITTLKPTIDQPTLLSKHHHHLIGTPAAMCRMNANKLESVIRQSPLEITFYRMSAADMIRHQYYPHELNHPSSLPIEDQYSSTSFDSTNSSISDVSPPIDHNITGKTKKHSYNRLLREIRRLRSENAGLRNSVNILKEDLRHERESRQIAEQVHKKYFDDSINKHTQLELEILDQQDQLTALRNQLVKNNHINTNTSITSYYNNLSSSLDDEVCPLWGCEDMDCNNERKCYDEINHDQNNHDEEDDEEDDPSAIEEEFEDLAISYLRQALVSNLTSARANLEFDDLMLKYDPSPDRVLKTLADAFLGWIRDTIHTSTPTSSSIDNDTELDQDRSLSVARLMTTQIQDVFIHFWKAILERYVHNDEDQYQFLHQAERILLRLLHQGTQPDQTYQESQYIVQNFHRLLVMLYKYDIVDGDAVTTWWHTLPSPATFENNNDHDLLQLDLVADQLRNVTRKFVEWVDDDDDEEDDDDNDNNQQHHFHFDSHDDDIDDDDEINIDNDDVDAQFGNDLGLNETSSLSTNSYAISSASIHPEKKKSVTIQV
ncbi:uncharacterized protein BX664DRAFT_357904 [Halteromyces radiatus]|uniref:uncharacterized protein n=1 Tax=Halteromyces radiatus TaxID=101107 RepID=UPI00221E642F|nr:uncharacterized protein BX664DRAFT_357904 [Halteromyces radiatus]KAI8093457.1 hypothetical protein BX664DRAFT_357904 [Halteromyces radiatus]